MGDAFSVYETLRMHANHKTGLCKPRHSTLLKETGIKSVNTLRRRINKLRKLGLVQIVKEPTPNTSTEYRIITAPYLPTYSEDQMLTPAKERGSKSDTREDQNLTVRGSKFDTREDQNLIPNKKNRTRRNNNTQLTTLGEGEPMKEIKPSLTGKKENKSIQPTSGSKKDNMFRGRQGVPLTANQQAKAMIEEFCDWDKFFKARKTKLEESSYWQNSSARIVDGTILKPYRELLDKSDPRKPWNTETDRAMAIAEVKELIKTHVEELGLNKESATQQAQQGGLNAELASLIELHKKNPLQALKLARGNPLIYNKFIKQVQTNAS